MKILKKAAVAVMLGTIVAVGGATAAYAGTAQLWDVTCLNWRTGSSWSAASIPRTYASTYSSSPCVGAYARVAYSVGGSTWSGTATGTFVQTYVNALYNGGHHKGSASGAIWTSQVD